MDEQVEMIYEHPSVQAFQRFHKANPHVYRLFEKFAFQARNRRNRFSAATILQRIRWATMIETDDPDFKINNNWSPFYVRLLLEQHPQRFKDFFVLRKSIADR